MFNLHSYLATQLEASELVASASFQVKFTFAVTVFIIFLFHSRFKLVTTGFNLSIFEIE